MILLMLLIKQYLENKIMNSALDIYKKYQAQTFPYPSLLQIGKADGSYIFDINNKKSKKVTFLEKLFRMEQF